MTSDAPTTPRSGLTSVQIGRERIAYLDALAVHYGQPSRTGALFAAWCDVSGQGDTLTLARPRPPRAPLPISLRPFAHADIPTPICQLSGPAWAHYGPQAQALARAAGAPLSQVCRDVIDAHAERFARDLVGR